MTITALSPVDYPKTWLVGPCVMCVMTEMTVRKCVYHYTITPNTTAVPWLPAFTFTSRFPYYELERIVHLEIGLPSRLLARFECTPFQRVFVFERALILLWYIRSRGQPWVSVDQE